MDKLAAAWGPTLKQGQSTDDGPSSDGQKLADALSKKWKAVKFDPKRGQGTANIGGLKIKFSDSGNDPAVVVEIVEHPRMKADAESMLAALGKLAKVFNTL